MKVHKRGKVQVTKSWKQAKERIHIKRTWQMCADTIRDSIGKIIKVSTDNVATAT